MKVTTFVILQSQKLKKARIFQKGKIYLFEIQSKPNLNFHIVVKHKNLLTLGRLATPSSRLRPDGSRTSYMRVIHSYEKLAEC
jgi:hypothetical protein